MSLRGGRKTDKMMSQGGAGVVKKMFQEGEITVLNAADD